MEPDPIEIRLEALPDTEMDGYFLLLSFLDGNSMIISGLIAFVLSLVDGRPLEEDGRRC
jgi:hypothetical protein